MSVIAKQGFVNTMAQSFRCLGIALALAFIHLGPAVAEDKSKTLLVVGDSLSAAYGLSTDQGWVSLLAAKLTSEHPQWRVVNASISGETTAGGVARIDSELKRHQPQLVIIELGANDGLRGLPLDVATANLRKMIVAAKAVQAEVLLIGMRIPPNYGPEYTDAFVSMYSELATEQNIKLLPFLMATIATDRANYLDDNLHPNATAQPALLQHVWTALAPMLR